MLVCQVYVWTVVYVWFQHTWFQLMEVQDGIRKHRKRYLVVLVYIQIYKNERTRYCHSSCDQKW